MKLLHFIKSPPQGSDELHYVDVRTCIPPVMPPAIDSNVQYTSLHHNQDTAAGMTSLDYPIQLFCTLALRLWW